MKSGLDGYPGEAIMRVALLEDDPIELRLLMKTLEAPPGAGDERMICMPFLHMQLLRDALSTQAFDLLILETITLEDRGLVFLQWLRRLHQSTFPVIVLSSRGTARDMAEAFDAGADDYVLKPFRPAEIRARALRFQEPARQRLGPKVSVGDWSFLLERSTVAYAGPPEESFDLNEQEFKLLLMLFGNHGQVVSRFDLLEATHNKARSMNTRVLDNRIFRLRQALRLEDKGVLLQTIYGKGYRLVIRASAADSSTKSQAEKRTLSMYGRLGRTLPLPVLGV